MNFFDDVIRFSERTAITDTDGRSYTYAEVISAGDRIAKDIPTRSLVFLVCENNPESIEAYIGFLRKRVVPVLISPKTDKDLFTRLICSYHPGYIFCPNGYWEGGNKLLDAGGSQLIGTDNESVPPPMNPELAVLITTSGSTGSPKFVMQSYKNITSNACSIAEYLGINEDDRAITTMPMSYTFGLSIIQSHFQKGARVITTEKTLMDKGFWSLIKEQQATTFGGVPYIYDMLRRLRFERMDLPSLRYITQAGGKLSKEASLEFSEICRNKGIKFIIMYGQTEATARISYLPWEYAFTKAGSIGIAIPGGKLSLANPDGSLITTPETVGELIYEGDNVSLGYAESSEDLAKPDQRHGILATGDMAKFDNDGFFYITGRKKRFLKVFGNRINLDEIEELLRRAGYDCVCGGRDDNIRIYMENADEKVLAGAVDHISGKTGLNRSAFKAIPVKKIPRNDSGKVLYSKLEELDG